MSLIGISRKKKDPAAAGPVHVEADSVFITEAAADHLRKKAAEEAQPDGVLRIGVKGGGCSGLSYHFSIEAGPTERDKVFAQHGVRVIVDPKSLTVLGGMILDADLALGRSGFLVKNPHAKSSCSCGESFSI